MIDLRNEGRRRDSPGATESALYPAQESQYGRQHLQHQLLNKPPLSPSPMKRSNTIHGTSPSRRNARSLERMQGRQVHTTGGTNESIVHMRQEIMESMQRSPTKLYDENDRNGVAGRQPNGHRSRQGADDYNRSGNISMDHANTSRLEPDSGAKVIGSYHDDIFDTDIRQPAYNIGLDNGADEDEDEEDDDDKLNIPFNNHNSISHSMSSNERRKKNAASLRIPPTKRVLSRAASPEKPQLQASRIPAPQHPRKRTKNSPPANLQTIPVMRPEKSKGVERQAQTAEATLRPRQAHGGSNSGAPRQSSNRPPAQERPRQEREHLLDMNTPKGMEKTAKVGNGAPIRDDLPEDDEVEEIEVHGDNLHKRDEVSLIDSTTFLNSSTNISDLSKLKAIHSTELASLKAQLAGKEIELDQMRASMQFSEQKAFDNERKLAETLEHVAQELHAQYSRKHEAKVQALKKQHEAILASRLKDMESRIHELEQDLEQERREKDELVKTCDMYLEMEELRAQEEGQQPVTQRGSRHAGQ